MNQQWKVVYQGNGWYKLFNLWPAYNNYCLDVESWSNWNVDVYTNNNSGDWLLWRILPNGDGTFRLINKWTATAGGRVLDVEGASKDAYANVGCHDWNGGENQRWVFEKAENQAAAFGEVVNLGIQSIKK